MVLSRGKAADAGPAGAAGRAKVEALEPLRDAAATCKASFSSWCVSASRRCRKARLNERIVGAVERELIEQVLVQCDDVQVTAARKLGINRNTLHKKVSMFNAPANDSGKDDEGATSSKSV